MLKRLIAIAVIYCGAGLAWLILGSTLEVRTAQSDAPQQQRLLSQWGSAQTQSAPQITGAANRNLEVPIRSSRIGVRLDLERRRAGLLWYDLYDVLFHGRYVIRNTTGSPHLAIRFPLPASDGSYADFTYAVGGRPIDNAAVLDRPRVIVDVDPGATTTLDVSYRSRGTESWQYRFKDGVESVRDFALTMKTNFDAIDFPPGSLLPTTEQAVSGGWQLQWNYSTLVTGNAIGLSMPEPLQPGPLAQRITFWAPVALLFYFFVMLLITTLRRIDVHPVNYFFLACAFFAFHLLFAYLVDRISLESAFVICAAVSMFLTVSYLRLVTGWRFAAFESGLAQLVYLVLFSYALFNEGWSGLTITCGAILTLFVAMQATGRIRWSERLAAT